MQSGLATTRVCEPHFFHVKHFRRARKSNTNLLVYFIANVLFLVFHTLKQRGRQVAALSFRALLTNVSHQLSIKNVKLTSLKWNTVVFRARDAAKRDALAYEMHLVIPLATGMEKVH